MKFGKRFKAAQGESAGEYISYKSLKQALKHDCLHRDALGAQFEQVRITICSWNSFELYVARDERACATPVPDTQTLGASASLCTGRATQCIGCALRSSRRLYAVRSAEIGVVLLVIPRAAVVSAYSLDSYLLVSSPTFDAAQTSAPIVREPTRPYTLR
jgi:hypothetical protein